MTTVLSNVGNYKKEGYLTGIDILDTNEATNYRQQFDILEAQVGREQAEIGLIDWHFKQKFVWEMATHPKILDQIEAIVGPNILLLATHFFCKYGDPAAEEEKFVAWHQDVTFWGLEPAYAITAWYAVDDVDQANGCMRVVPGTHVDGIQEHGKAQQEGNLLSINQEVAVSAEDEERAVDIVLKAGQMSLHDGTLIHGSLTNNSDRRRCGLTLRYVPNWQAILVRGEDMEQNFTRMEAPF